MKIVDANVILRYLLNDVESLVVKAISILENEHIYVPNEIIAEVVYVLEKVYKIERNDIKKAIIELLDYDNIRVQDVEIIKEALDLYSQRKLDFVDTLLYGYNKIRNYKIYTFDKKLNNLLIT